MRKTLITAVQNVLGEVSLKPTAQVFSSPISDVQLMLSLTTAVCEELVKDHQWSDLLEHFSFTTVPGQAAYALPEDFERLVPDTMWNESMTEPMYGSLSPVNDARVRNSTANGTACMFQIKKGKLYISPTPTSAQTISFDYISGYFALTPGTMAPKPAFTQDSDLIVFDGRLVVAAVKLKWLSTNSLDTTDALAEYNALRDRVVSNDGSPASSYGRRRTGLIGRQNLPEGNWGV